MKILNTIMRVKLHQMYYFTKSECKRGTIVTFKKNVNFANETQNVCISNYATIEDKITRIQIIF